MATRKHTNTHTYTRDSQCNHASVGLAQARPNKHQASHECPYCHYSNKHQASHECLYYHYSNKHQASHECPYCHYSNKHQASHECLYCHYSNKHQASHECLYWHYSNQHQASHGPTVKRGTDCGMDSFRGLTGSENML